ncbi:MAG: tRNA (N6-threonylcarbamoyladenosine(37)-N6)-methyltransferase TrmO [Candidatus Helarchaeota archaeon]
MSELKLKPIGFVENEIEKPIDPHKFKDIESKLIINPEYEEALYRIEENEYIIVITYFHKSHEPHKLKGPTYYGEVKGIFASRSPIRPNPIGLTTVKLLKKDKNVLIVKGLDSINKTPIIDIKPYSPGLDHKEIERVRREINIANPRRHLMPLIMNWDLKSLLDEAAVLHGHYCSGLAMGVMMGAHAMREFAKFRLSDGMENLIAIVEMNHCATDGIQYVTGCTFGNNALIFRDFGKTVLILTDRSGKGIRVALKPFAMDQFLEKIPGLNELFNKVVKERSGTPEDLEKLKQLMRKSSFELIKQKFEDLFEAKIIDIDFQEWAPIEETIYCAKCGESTIPSKAVKKGDKYLCIPCSRSDYYELSGHGIKLKKFE